MKQSINWLGLITLALTIAGCSTEPHMSYADYRATLAPPQAGMGRIWFYRTHIFWGDAAKSQVNVDWKRVGVAVPGYFFMVEKPEGLREIETVTEWPQRVIVKVNTNEDIYIKMAVRPGVILGHIVPV